MASYSWVADEVKNGTCSTCFTSFVTDPDTQPSQPGTVTVSWLKPAPADGLCRHVFHTKCLQRWLARPIAQNRCPICKCTGLRIVTSDPATWRGDWSCTQVRFTEVKTVA